MDPETRTWKQKCPHLPHDDPMFPAPSTQGMTGLVVIVPKEGTLLSEDTGRISLNYKPWPLPGHFACLVPRDQQARKGAAILARFIDADYQEGA